MVLNLTEAAAFVGVSPPMVSQWLAYGYITKPDGWKRRQGVNIMFEVPHLREIMLVKELRSIRVPQDVIAKHTDVLKQLGARPFTRATVLLVDFDNQTISFVDKANIGHSGINAGVVALGLPVDPDFAHLYTDVQEGAE